MTFEGFFELNDARDLFKKLERDYHRLQENPLDQDAAFDFFVLHTTCSNGHIPVIQPSAARWKETRSS